MRNYSCYSCVRISHYLEIYLRNISKNIIVSSRIDQLNRRGRGELILFLHKRNVTPNLIKRTSVVITSICQTKCSESSFPSNLTKFLKMFKNKMWLIARAQIDSSITRPPVLKFKGCSLMMLCGINLLIWEIDLIMP